MFPTRDREGCAAGRPGAPRLRARRARHLGTAAAAVAALLFLVLLMLLGAALRVARRT